ncbi:hypothetical protein [Alkalibacillus silvisoli]|uniref:Uncharacterized protein n=1 Tax=Alkalibacillus silvisoli TaxID=392823 RepID=A0ABN0ZL96_9BACI
MKLIAKVLIVIGFLSVLLGIIPTIFTLIVYPSVEWETVLDLIAYVLFETPERGLWQVGVVIWLIGLWLLSRERKKGRIFY